MTSRANSEFGATRILVVDSRPEVRSALRLLLEQDTGMTISAEASTARELMHQVQLSCPDVILLDCDLPDLRVREYMPQLRSLCPSVHVVAMCSRDEMRRVAVSTGADAFISKMDPPHALVNAIKHRLGARESDPHAAQR